MSLVFKDGSQTATENTRHLTSLISIMNHTNFYASLKLCRYIHIIRAVKFSKAYQFPECNISKPSLIFSNGRLCVTNSSRINSLDRYCSTNFGTLCLDFHPPNAVPFHTRPVTNWNGLVLISWPAAATPIITDVPHPLWQDSNAALWRIIFIGRYSFS